MDNMLHRSGKVAATLAFLIIGSAAARADAIDDYVAAQMQRQHIPGLALVVVKEGKAVKVKGYGLANVELNVAVTPDTVFKIGSVSKQFIATGAMLLVNDGKVGLDDPIGNYLDGSPESWKGITVRHLLTHSSGLVRESPGFAAFKLQSDADVIKAAYETPLRFQPGEKFEYCNLGYFILAEIIHKTSGMDWPAFMEQRVFKPLGMNATRATDAAAIIEKRANGYAFADGKMRNALAFIALRPSGAFVSTALDLIKWNAALDAGTVLPKAVLEQMWTPFKLNDGKTHPYGFGWYLDPVGGHRQIHHGGSLGGFRSEFTRLVDDKLSVVVLTNLEGARPDSIAVNVAAKYIAGLLPNRVVAKVEPEVLSQYTGQYQFGPGFLATVTRRDNGLMMDVAATGQQTRLVPMEVASFFSPDDPRPEYVFVKDAGGAITHLAIKSEGIEMSKGSRLP